MVWVKLGQAAAAGGVIRTEVGTRAGQGALRARRPFSADLRSKVQEGVVVCLCQVRFWGHQSCGELPHSLVETRSSAES